MKKILMLLFLLIFGHAQNNLMDSKELKDLEYVNSVMKVYSQTIQWQHPKWPAVHKNQTRSSFIMEFIPKEQKLESWKDMLTIQGFVDLAKRKNVTVDIFKESLVNRFKKISSNEVLFKEFFHGNINGYESSIFLLGLKKVPNVKGSELALYIVTKGKNDFYVIQRAWRGERIISKNFPFSKKEFTEWYDILREVKIY